MSWEIFKQNVQRKLCDASKVPSIEYVAEVYATEYDACIKRGGTLIDRIPVIKGNVEGMKQAFIRALQAGLNYTTPYDLTGAMGTGVITYWTQAELAIPNPPLVTQQQVSTSAVQNITATKNNVTIPGRWRNTNIPVQTPNPPQTTTPIQNNNNTTNQTNNTQKILIVGDSISVDVKTTWSGIFKEKNKNLNVEILAIAGKQLTLWMKPQLEEKLKNNKYDKVYIYGGVNDTFSSKSANQIITALQSMVNSITSTGAKAIVITGYDAERDMLIQNMPITTYVRDRKNYQPLLNEYIKFQSIIDRITGATIVPKISVGGLSDGFHPSFQQSQKLYQHISKF